MSRQRRGGGGVTEGPLLQTKARDDRAGHRAETPSTRRMGATDNRRRSGGGRRRPWMRCSAREAPWGGRGSAAEDEAARTARESRRPRRRGRAGRPLGHIAVDTGAAEDVCRGGRGRASPAGTCGTGGWRSNWRPRRRQLVLAPAMVAATTALLVSTRLDRGDMASRTVPRRGSSAKAAPAAATMTGG